VSGDGPELRRAASWMVSLDDIQLLQPEMPEFFRIEGVILALCRHHRWTFSNELGVSAIYASMNWILPNHPLASPTNEPPTLGKQKTLPPHKGRKSPWYHPCYSLPYGSCCESRVSDSNITERMKRLSLIWKLTVPAGTPYLRLAAAPICHHHEHDSETRRTFQGTAPERTSAASHPGGALNRWRHLPVGQALPTLLHHSNLSKTYSDYPYYNTFKLEMQRSGDA